MSPQHLGAESIVTADQMRTRLAQLASQPSEPPAPAITVTDERWELRRRVALLDYFAVRDLASGARRRPETSDSPTLQQFVAEDCEVVTTRAGTRWRLHLDVRHETLARLGPRGALALLDRPDALRPGRDDVTHQMARRLLAGERGLGDLSPTQLSGILKAREWLAPLGLNLPAEADVHRALDLADVLAPLKAVARPDFVGRDDELALLEAYVASDDPEPLSIHGPGGVGKSALLAKFILDHLDERGSQAPAGGRIGFCYLTFDRADLDPAAPLTLVREMLRQLGLQLPAVAERTAAAIRDVDTAIASEAAIRREIAAYGGSTRGFGTRDLDRSVLEQEYYVNLLGRVVASGLGGAPFVVLLDTFEVAQRRRRSSLHVLRRALESMAEMVPRLRVLVAGRAEPTELTDHHWAITGLDAEQARLLMLGATAGLTLPEGLVDDVVDRVHGNPLSLRLAAELMRREGEETLATQRGRRRFLFGLREEQVQGILYRRILDHIDTRVRPLANPGLVVRRITPDVILRVLAKPCGLEPMTPARADGLFDVLAEEAGLVTETSPHVLVHRDDVRREMLPLLRDESAESAARVKRIHRLAVDYYRARPGAEDRVEELYHRLMLGQSAKVLESRWDDTAAYQLESAMPELPSASRVFLANKHPDAEASAEDLTAAGYAAWVAQVTRQARRLLDAGQSEKAAALLHGGPTPATVDPDGFPEDDPAITALMVQAHAASRRRGYALEIARKGIDAAERRGLPQEYVMLTVLAGRVAEDDEQFDQAWRYFNDGWETANDLGQRIAAMEAGAGVLRVSRRSSWGQRRGDAQAVRVLKQQLIVQATSLTSAEKQQYPTLLRELAAEVGDAVPNLLADAAEHLGIAGAGQADGYFGPAAERALDEYVSTHQPGPRDQVPPSSAAQGKAVADALRQRPDDDALRETVTKYWQLEADMLSFDAYDDQGK